MPDVDPVAGPSSKICPFCAEEILEAAVKCRHCHSMLLPGVVMPPTGPSNTPPVPSGQVTYVVDEGIVKFGKFAAAVLAIFTLLGLYVLQIDIKKTASEMQLAQRDMEKSRDELAKSGEEISEGRLKIRGLVGQAKKSEEEIAKMRKAFDLQAKELGQLFAQSQASTDAAAARSAAASNEARRASAAARSAMGDAQGALAAIGVLLTKSQQVYAAIDEYRIRTLGEDGQKLLAEVKDENPGQFRAATDATSSDAALAKLWPKGATLTIRFLDGSETQRRNFRFAMKQWLDHANLLPEYVDVGAAKIRVSFAQQGSWSNVGTDALGVPAGNPTINLGFANPGSPPPNYLHEIGHTLGLVHETSNPNTQLDYDRAAIFGDLAGPPNFWSQDQIEANIFQKAPYPGSRAFDGDSIMNLPLPPKWLRSGVGISLPTVLSASDKAYIRSLYP